MFEKAVQLLKDSMERGDFPGGAVAIGCRDQLFVAESFGNRQVNPSVLPMEPDTLFDMASLSKILGTTMVALRFIEQGKLGLYDEVGMFFDETYGKGGITIRQLMTHCSGLHPSLHLWELCDDPKDAADAILKSDLVYPTGTEVQYSCMGFILLAKILEKIGGAPLDELAKKEVFEPLGMKTACYCPKTENVVTTEYSEFHGGWTKGEVHDENACFLNGVSGNAGVFASLSDIIRIATMLSCGGKIDGKTYLTERTLQLATTNWTREIPGESRGWGFQLKENGYSICGDLFSEGSFGHSGFTGTSMYIDRETGFYLIFLSNAVHYGRENRDGFFRTRRLVHNLAIDEFLRNQEKE
jgi:CubicO group peptidase (beta-lactamase class C family)